MATSTTPRAGLPRWSAPTDAWPARAGWDSFMALLDNIIALSASYATLSARPAAGVRDRYAYVVAEKRFYYDTGTEWVEIGAVGGVAPTAETYGATASEGTSVRAARGDHRHAMPAHDAAAHAAIPLSAFAAPTAAVPMGGQKVTGLGVPSAPNDAARFSDVGAPVVTTGTPAADTRLGTRGTASTAARSDHAHPSPVLLLEAGAPVPADTPVGTLIFEKKA